MLAYDEERNINMDEDYTDIFKYEGLSFVPLGKVAIPDKLSELLRRVVADMRTVLNRDEVEFEMGVWADFTMDDGCAVCAAGAYILAECFPDGYSYDHGTDIVNYIDAVSYPAKHLIDNFRDFSVHRVRDRDIYNTPDDVLCGLAAIFGRISERYDPHSYLDVVKWFNTAAAYLESRGY